MATNRTIKDAKLVVTRVAPAAAANADSSSLDLGQVTAFPINEVLELQIAVPATDTLVEDKVLTVTVQDSADDSTFAAVATLPTVVVTGAATNISAAKTTVLKLAGSVRRYIRINVAVETGGGDVTDTTVSARLLV